VKYPHGSIGQSLKSFGRKRHNLGRSGSANTKKRGSDENLVRFSTARLVKHLNGRIELIGGSDSDCGEAREWCSLFLDAVVDGGSGQTSRLNRGSR